MAAENRITQTNGTKARKTTKQLASCTSASPPLKRLVGVPPTPKCMKESSAKSSSTSSSDSGSGRRGLNGGNAISKLKGTKDALELAKLSTSESTSTEFTCVSLTEPEETSKCNPDAAEPSILAPEQQFKDLDVVHSNLAVNWFSFGDHEVDDFLKTKTDQNPDMTVSEKQLSLLSAAKAPEYPYSVPLDTDNGDNDEFQGADSREYSNTTSSQDKKFEDDKVVEEELKIETPNIKECSRRKNYHECEDGPTLSETSEETIEAKAQQDSMQTKASRNLLGLKGNGTDACRGWWCSKAFLPGLFVLIAIWFLVGNWIDNDFGVLPPLT